LFSLRHPFLINRNERVLLLLLFLRVVITVVVVVCGNCCWSALGLLPSAAAVARYEKLHTYVGIWGVYYISIENKKEMRK
jgi:hypothetical protein